MAHPFCLWLDGATSGMSSTKHAEWTQPASDAPSVIISLLMHAIQKAVQRHWPTEASPPLPLIITHNRHGSTSGPRPHETISSQQQTDKTLATHQSRTGSNTSNVTQSLESRFRAPCSLRSRGATPGNSASAFATVGRGELPGLFAGPANAKDRQ
jgi:hypothetical protein